MTATALLLSNPAARHVVVEADYVAAIHELRKLTPIEAAYLVACITEGMNRKRSRAFAEALEAAVNAPSSSARTVDDLFAKPIGQCSRCGRKTWAIDAINTKCSLPQPASQPCDGMLLLRPN